MELSCPLRITRCPSAWHRKFNPGAKRPVTFSVNSQHLPKRKEREWNLPGVVKILFHAATMNMS